MLINCLKICLSGAKIFIKNAHELGIQVYSSKNINWHIDGCDRRITARFGMLKGLYLTKLPKGGMKKGDVVFAHPWLAHGIDTNRSNTPRLALYYRLKNQTYSSKLRG